MQPQALNCPMCGAAARRESTACEHCGSRLATVACPSCFGMLFRGTEYCPHCGTKAARQETGTTPASQPSCPRCAISLAPVVLGTVSVRECARCNGLWVDKDAFEKICAEKEGERPVLGSPSLLPTAPPQPANQIRYVPCPACRKLMNRVNFAHCSGIIVDVCREHGTWFDRDELRRIIAFIRAGGMEVSRERKRAELLQQEQRLRRLQAASAADRAREDGEAIVAARGILGSFFP